MGLRHHLSFCACNTAWLAPELLVSMGPNPYLWFLHAKQRLLEQNYKYQCVPTLICGFCLHISAFWTRISSLYGSQTSSVVLSTHNCVLSTRIKSLYGFQPSPVVLCMQNSDFRTRITCLYGSQTSSVFFGCKTATLTLELLVSLGPSPHLCFLVAKQRLLDQNNKSLRVPEKPVVLCMENSNFSIWITRLYGTQTSPVVLCMQNSVIST